MPGLLSSVVLGIIYHITGFNLIMKIGSFVLIILHLSEMESL